jgi:transposase
MPETPPRLPLESDDARALRLVTVVTAVMRDCFFGRSDVVPAPERLQQLRQLMSRHTLSSLDAPRRGLFVSDVVDALDLSPILATYETGDGRGQPPYHPALMVKLLLYAYCTGKPSSRQIEQATYEEVPYRVLAADQHPDHDTLAAFRQQHLPALAALFAQVLDLCRRAGLVKLGHVALDGTKVLANASKHKAMSYGRMVEAEPRLQQEIAALLAEAQRVDAAEDAQYGKGRRGDELPAELARRESRLAKIRAAKAALEAEAKAQAVAAADAAQTKLADRERRAPPRSPIRPKPPRSRRPSGTSPIPSPGS